MSLKLRPKTYGPLVLDSASADELVFRTEAGQAGVGARTPRVGGLSPSDLLLASLANCISISLRMAAQAMGIELAALRTTTRATKAIDEPNRFERLDVEIWSSLPIDPARADELLRRTKALCTISNTLSAEVVLSLGSGPAPAG